MVDKIDFSKGSPARQIIANDFRTNINWIPFKEWYFESFEQIDISNLADYFYKFCEKENKILSYVSWFINNYLKYQIDVFERDFIIFGSNETHTSTYPPQTACYTQKKVFLLTILFFLKLSIKKC